MYGKLKLFFENGETERETSFGIRKTKNPETRILHHLLLESIYEIDDVVEIGSGIQS